MGPSQWCTASGSALIPPRRTLRNHPPYSCTGTTTYSPWTRWTSGSRRRTRWGVVVRTCCAVVLWTAWDHALGPLGGGPLSLCRRVASLGVDMVHHDTHNER